jgi:hypothetical protein
MRGKSPVAVLSLALLITFSAVSAAHAGFIGRTVSAGYFFPDLATPYPFASATPPSFVVVDPGAETTIDVEGVTFITIDLTDTSLRFDFATVLTSPTWSTAPFNGVVLELIGGAPFSLLSASIDPSSTLSGFDLSDLTFSDTQVTANWNGLSYTNGTTLLINFTTAAVPEPTTLSLLGITLVVLALSRKRHWRVPRS